MSTTRGMAKDLGDSYNKAMAFFKAVLDEFIPDKVPFPDLAIIVVTHIVANVPPFLAALKSLGNNISIAGIIPKSTQPDGPTLKYLQDEKYNFIQATRTDLEDKTKLIEIIQKNTDEKQLVAILDVGARFARHLECLVRSICGRTVIGISEDTRNGELEYQKKIKTLAMKSVPYPPVASVARSRGKGYLEDKITGENIVEATHYILATDLRTLGLARNNSVYGVIGLGPVGTGAANRLKILNYRVIVWELDPVLLARAAEAGFEVATSKQYVLDTCNVVVLCDGQGAMNAEDFSKCKQPKVVFASCTSKDSEAKGIEGLQPPEVKQDNYAKYIFEQADDSGEDTQVSEVYLLRGLDAVNFTLGGLRGPEIYPVLAELLLSVAKFVAPYVEEKYKSQMLSSLFIWDKSRPDNIYALSSEETAIYRLYLQFFHHVTLEPIGTVPRPLSREEYFGRVEEEQAVKLFLKQSPNQQDEEKKRIQSEADKKDEKKGDRTAAKKVTELGKVDQSEIKEITGKTDYFGKVLFIHGPTGYGKTTLVRQIGSHFAYGYSLMWWFDTNRAESYRKLANNMNLSTLGKGLADVITLVFKNLAKLEKFLFIYDEVTDDDIKVVMREYQPSVLPETSDGCFIFIRAEEPSKDLLQSLGIKFAVKACRIDGLDAVAARNFLPFSVDGIDKFTQDMLGHPILLQIASAYLKTSKNAPREYFATVAKSISELSATQKTPLKVLQKLLGITLLEINKRPIQGQLTLLFVSTFLDTNAILGDIYSSADSEVAEAFWSANCGDQSVCSSILTKLTRFALMTQTVSSNGTVYYHMHQLVREALLDMLPQPTSFAATHSSLSASSSATAISSSSSVVSTTATSTASITLQGSEYLSKAMELIEGLFAYNPYCLPQASADEKSRASSKKIKISTILPHAISVVQLCAKYQQLLVPLSPIGYFQILYKLGLYYLHENRSFGDSKKYLKLIDTSVLEAKAENKIFVAQVKLFLLLDKVHLTKAYILTEPKSNILSSLDTYAKEVAKIAKLFESENTQEEQKSQDYNLEQSWVHSAEAYLVLGYCSIYGARCEIRDQKPEEAKAYLTAAKKNLNIAYEKVEHHSKINASQARSIGRLKHFIRYAEYSVSLWGGEYETARDGFCEEVKAVEPLGKHLDVVFARYKYAIALLKLIENTSATSFVTRVMELKQARALFWLSCSAFVSWSPRYDSGITECCKDIQTIEAMLQLLEKQMKEAEQKALEEAEKKASTSLVSIPSLNLSNLQSTFPACVSGSYASITSPAESPVGSGRKSSTPSSLGYSTAAFFASTSSKSVVSSGEIGVYPCSQVVGVTATAPNASLLETVGRFSPTKITQPSGPGSPGLSPRHLTHRLPPSHPGLRSVRLTRHTSAPCPQSRHESLTLAASFSALPKSSAVSASCISLAALTLSSSSSS